MLKDKEKAIAANQADDAADEAKEKSPGVDSLNSILKNTIHTIEESKGQILGIYDAARSEIESMRDELATIREETTEAINNVNGLERDEQREKQNLVRVSSNFIDFSEEKIRLAYNAIKDVQVRLAIAREKERLLRKKRDDCEIRLYHMQKTTIGAEQLAMRISSVLGYLSSQMSDVVAQMEKASQNRFLAAMIIKAQEDERYRVAREIHDGPAQDIANLLLQTSICERLIPIDPEEACASLQELRRQLRGCLNDVRQVIFDMRPMSLDDLGLTAAISQLIATLDERHLLDVDFSVEGEEFDLPNHISTGIFRIIQEALKNIERHSGQKNAQVRILYTPAAVSILVEDRGKGFDADAIVYDAPSPDSGKGHFGIVGMKERAKIIGAQLTVTSSPNRGTKVHLRLPLKIEATTNAANTASEE